MPYGRFLVDNIADIAYFAGFVLAAGPGKPWSGIANISDIANIAYLVFGKPWLGIADIAAIADIASFVFGKPRLGIADNADIASFAFCKPRQTPSSSDICKQEPTVEEPRRGERNSCSYCSSCA